MIIVASQLNDWGVTSDDQAQVYANGYFGNGLFIEDDKIMSWLFNKK